LDPNLVTVLGQRSGDRNSSALAAVNTVAFPVTAAAVEILHVELQGVITGGCRSGDWRTGNFAGGGGSAKSSDHRGGESRFSAPE